MSADRDLLGTLHRQSPLAVVFLALRILRGVGAVNIVIAVVFLFNAPIAGGLFVVVPLLGLALFGFATLAWWRYTFVLVGDELHVTKGVLSIDRLTIPLERVQSVSIDQDFIRRPLGLVRASLDTAGTSEAEFTIDAVDRAVALALQRLSAEQRTTVAPATPTPADLPPPPPVPDEVLITRTPPQLVKVGLAQSPWTGLALLGPLIAFAGDLGGYLGLELPDIDENTDLGPWILQAVVIAVVIGTLLSVVLQVGREVVTNWELTLARTATGLRRSSGLLSRQSRSAPLSRVQRVGTHQTIIQRWFGFRALALPTIGEGDLSIPGCDDSEIDRVRRLVLGPDEIVDSLDRRVSPLAVFLEVRNATVVVLPVTVALVIAFGWWALLLLGILPIVAGAARRRQRLLRWGIAEAGLAKRTRFVSTTTSEIGLRKTQSVAIRQSFFERRRELATVKVSTARGSITIPMIALAEARAVRDRVLFIAETDARAWM